MKPGLTESERRAKIAEYAALEGMNTDVTTYPANPTPEAQAAHAKYLALERDGKVARYVDNDGATHPSGAPFIIWRPVDVAAPAPLAAVPDDEGDAHN